MRQLTLASASFDKHSKQTRRAKFLAEMDQVVPWRELCALVAPFYPKFGSGRPPIGLERMLRLHFLQHWFTLSDPAAEEAIYDSLSMRRFVGIDVGREPVLDETTILNLRHLLERHNLGKPLFERVNEHLTSRGLKVAGGTIVDATVIAAPSSTKNATSSCRCKSTNAWRTPSALALPEIELIQAFLNRIHTLSWEARKIINTR